MKKKEQYNLPSTIKHGIENKKKFLQLVEKWQIMGKSVMIECAKYRIQSFPEAISDDVFP